MLGLEVIPPKVPIRVSQAVHIAGMVALQVLHQARDAAFPLGLEHEVDVVVHEAKCMDPDLIAAGQPIKPVQVKDHMGFAIEDPLALRSALIDMIDLPALKVTKAWRQFGSKLGGHLRISVFPTGKISHLFSSSRPTLNPNNAKHPQPIDNKAFSI